MPHMKKILVLRPFFSAAVTCARSVKVPPVYLSKDASSWSGWPPPKSAAIFT